MSIATLILVTALQAAPGAGAAVVTDVDPVFAEWTLTTPGCAVGVDVDGRSVLEKGYGMADLERSVAIAPDTIFEAGSVSKQFTAAAVLLLARERRLSLDDPIHRYFPELPDYGAPVTIRQMLTHTSGLRDWGSVAGIAGWPRTTRAHTQAHVLDILSRQRALNFAPGTRWSYSNSGYNLAAMLVARLSGMSFAEFTRRRIFEPLGMASTSWRDDHTRLVQKRALAYDKRDDGYHLDMPFEDAHGNGGLLTTVGDLLRWSRNFRTPIVGDQAFVTEQTTPGRFSDGQAHDYGLGVTLGSYRGLREVRHSGSTAGYRAYLTVFPDRRAAVAVLCNGGNARAEALTYAVVDRVLAGSLTPTAAPRSRHTLTEAELNGLAGLYRHTRTGAATRLVREGGEIRIERGAVLQAESGARLRSPGRRWDFAGGRLSVTDGFGRVDAFERVAAWAPTAAELAAFEGQYRSAEAETAFTAAVEGGVLVLRQRPDRAVHLAPLYQGAFTGWIGTVVFRRDAGGRIEGFSINQDRVWDLRVERMVSPSTRSGGPGGARR